MHCYGCDRVMTATAAFSGGKLSFIDLTWLVTGHGRELVWFEKSAGMQTSPARRTFYPVHLSERVEERFNRILGRENVIQSVPNYLPLSADGTRLADL